MTSIEWQVWNSPTPKHVDVPIKTVNHSLRCGGFFEGMNGRRFFRGHHNMPLCGFVSVIIHQHHSVDGLNMHTSSKNITCKEQTSKILTKLLQDPVPQLGRRMNPFTCAFASLFPPTYIPIITLNPAFFKLHLMFCGDFQFWSVRKSTFPMPVVKFARLLTVQSRKRYPLATTARTQRTQWTQQTKRRKEVLCDVAEKTGGFLCDELW